MKKRLFLAIILSVVVLLSWSVFVSRTQHIDSQGVIDKAAFLQRAPIETPIVVPTTKPEPIPQKIFKFSNDDFDLSFDEPSATISEVVFKKYKNYKFSLKKGFLLGEGTWLFSKENANSEKVSFMYADENKKISKDFIFSNSKYTIELYIKIQNLSNLRLKVNLPLTLGVLGMSFDDAQARYRDVAIGTAEKTSHFNAKKNVSQEGIKFVAMRDQYFCAIVQPALENYSAFVRKLSPQESEISIDQAEISLGPGQELLQKFLIYLGPQQLKQINSIRPEWSTVVYYGTFDFIAQLLLKLLEFFHGLVKNWGWAIVLLSLLIYAVLFPLSLKQMRSMKEMQHLQPKVEELRRAYKDNPQKMNKEILELYREHKVNPLGGCLPLLLQMPIFFALYQALIRSVVLRGAHFLWIKDLSEPDQLFMLPFSLPVISNEVNILPILMAIGMFIQQKISMPKTNSEAAEQQKMMVIIMPIMFGLIFYRMPAGLVLYWFINSTLMLVYQYRISRIK